MASYPSQTIYYFYLLLSTKMSNGVASGGPPLQYVENFMLNQGVSASLGFLPSQPHFGDLAQSSSTYSGM